jgi:hypothetical protein
LRSSLNYIAWELATKFHAPPPVVGENRDIDFPLYDDPNGRGPHRLAEMAKKWSFPADVVDLIKSVQPHNAGYELLNILAVLRNSDEHCLPLLTVGYVQTSWLETQHPESAAIVGGMVGSGDSAGIVIRKINPADLGDFMSTGDIDALLERAKAREAASPQAPKEPARHLYVDGQVAVFVALRDFPVPLEPIERPIENLVKLVADIIARFEPFFV